MNISFTEAIKQLQSERGLSEVLVLSTVEEMLLAAYAKTFGTADNAVVQFSETGDDVMLYAKKTIVENDDLYDPVSEIELDKALELNKDCEVGDELLIEIDPKSFDWAAIQSSRQRTRQNIREIQKDTLYSEFKDKEGEIIIGYYQREKNGAIFVDLGKTDGILPKRFQSPREVYHHNDRIKAMIAEVNKQSSGIEIILSRTHSEFVRRIFELEVPEVYDGKVEILKIVREPGYRTKVAVHSSREDIDPVGACVGLKGVRIQAIVRELEGEKIDILKYDPEPAIFIRNALSPAEVQEVLILEPAKRQALAIVQESQLSLAIGKQGLNVRLANRLVDWNIDVKTEELFQEMEISREISRAATNLFSGLEGEENKEEITSIAELPDIPERLVSILQENGIELIENLINLTKNELGELNGLTPDDIAQIEKIIKDNVEIIEEVDDAEIEEVDDSNKNDDADGAGQDLVEEIDVGEVNESGDEDDEVEIFECPDCGSQVTIDMSECPNCGVGLLFEEVAEE